MHLGRRWRLHSGVAGTEMNGSGVSLTGKVSGWLLSLNSSSLALALVLQDSGCQARCLCSIRPFVAQEALLIASAAWAGAVGGRSWNLRRVALQSRSFGILSLSFPFLFLFFFCWLSLSLFLPFSPSCSAFKKIPAVVFSNPPSRLPVPLVCSVER